MNIFNTNLIFLYNTILKYTYVKCKGSVVSLLNFFFNYSNRNNLIYRRL